MRIELAHIQRALRSAAMSSIRIVQTGIGKDAVVRAAAREQGNFFILAGACGGLTPSEDVPPIARIVDERGHTWTPWSPSQPHPHAVTLAAVDRIISTPADKRALADATGAAIVDMESHAFAAECQRRAISWTIIRGVSDTPEETLPDQVMHWITPEGDTRSGRAVLDMVRRPSLIGHIVGVVRRSNRVLPQVGARVVEVIRAWERFSAAHGAQS